MYVLIKDVILSARLNKGAFTILCMSNRRSAASIYSKSTKHLEGFCVFAPINLI